MTCPFFRAASSVPADARIHPRVELRDIGFHIQDRCAVQQIPRRALEPVRQSRSLTRSTDTAIAFGRFGARVAKIPRGSVSRNGTTVNSEPETRCRWHTSRTWENPSEVLQPRMKLRGRFRAFPRTSCARDGWIGIPSTAVKRAAHDADCAIGHIHSALSPSPRSRPSLGLEVQCYAISNT